MVPGGVKQLSKGNRQKVEPEIKKIHDYLFSLLSNTSDGFILLNKQLRILYMSQAAKIILHPQDPDQIPGKDLGQVFNRDAAFYREVGRASSRQLPGHFEYSLSDTQQCLDVEVFPSSRGVSIWLRAITEPKKSEQPEKYFYHEIMELLDQIPNGFFILDDQGRFTYLNEGAGKFFAQAPGDLLGKQIWEEFPELAGSEIEERFKKMWAEQKVICFETMSVLTDRWFEVRIFPSRSGLFIHTMDIHARKRLELEIPRLDRLNSVGEMAAAIGHEIRNPLTTIRGFLQILEEKDECLKYKESFNLMIEELDRCNSIITEFLSFARKKESRFECANLNEIIEAIQPLAFSDAVIADKNLTFELEKIPDLYLDRNEIRQLILNLTRNGLDAMRPGQMLTVKTFSAGEEVVLMIQDQGRGIDPLIVKKIGTPFVTTKENGTGLGLAVCYNIAARHRAAISFETGSTGTTFFVRFPPPLRGKDLPGMADIENNE